MIEREIEKLALIETLINEVKENGFGEVVITIQDGCIVYAKKTERVQFTSQTIPDLTTVQTFSILKAI